MNNVEQNVELRGTNPRMLVLRVCLGVCEVDNPRELIFFNPRGIHFVSNLRRYFEGSVLKELYNSCNPG